MSLPLSLSLSPSLPLQFCVVCGKAGATLPCGAATSEGCLLTYHYPCAVQAGTHGEGQKCMYVCVV